MLLALYCLSIIYLVRSKLRKVGGLGGIAAYDQPVHLVLKFVLLVVFKRDVVFRQASFASPIL